jgi:CubicO group peptidase (beta-lactamase class C family)
MDLSGATGALDELVEQGRLPAYAAALRDPAGTVTTAAGGTADLATERAAEAGTAFRIASLSKPVAAILTLQLVEEEVLGLDDAIATWLPGLADLRVLARPGAAVTDTVPATAPVTVRHLTPPPTC